MAFDVKYCDSWHGLGAGAGLGPGLTTERLSITFAKDWFVGRASLDQASPPIGTTSTEEVKPSQLTQGC